MSQHVSELLPERRPTSPRPPGSANRTRLVNHPAFAALLLAAFTFAVFAPVLRHEFINYDDPMCVTENRHLENGLTWEGLRWALSTGYYGNWMPVTWLSHLLDIEWFGLNPAGHHATSLLLHVANAVLLFLLLRRLTGAHWRSAWVAGLFAWHPLRVEPVAWVAMRRDLLCTLFLLLTLGAYARYVSAARRQPSERSRRREAADETIRQDRPPTHAGGDATVHTFNRPTFNYALSLAFFALGLMSKPMLVTLPFLLLLLDYWPLGRWSFAGDPSPSESGGQSPHAKWRGERPMALLIEKLPFAALAVAAVVIAFATQQQAGALPGLTQFPLGDRLANALTSYVAYLRKTIWPADLAVFYPFPLSFPAWKVALAGLLLVVFTVVAVRGLRRRPWLAVGWFWYLSALVPVIGLVQIGSHSMADRYTYIPLIGIFVLIVWQWAAWAEGRAGRRAGVMAAAVVSLAVCALGTSGQLRHWRNTVALFERALAVTQDNAVAHDNLGAELCAQRQYDQARKHFEAAILLTPQNYVSQCHVGFMRFLDGKYDEAIAHFTEALRLRPGLAEAHSGLGAALMRQGRADEAMRHLREAIRLDPRDVTARGNLGNLLLRRGQTDEAMEQFTAALRLKPDDAVAHLGLGTALAGRGKLEEAIRHFAAALRAHPDSVQAHKLLAKALAEKGDLPAAAAEYSAALRFDPRDVETLNQLGTTLAQQGKLDEAIAQFNRALDVGTNVAGAHENLGLAFMLQGKTAQAVTHFNEALRQRPDSPEALNNLAWLLATHREAQFRNGPRAVDCALRAVALTRTNDVGKLDTLAAAFAEAGRFAEAEQTARQAAERAEAAGNKSLANDIQARLKLYQAGQPYRE